jgi:flavorubredoxin
MSDERHTEIELEEVADDTFVCHAYRRDPWPSSGLAPWISVNLMVVRGEQPTIVDSGAVSDRAALFATLDGLVNPVDVRWLFLSHHDPDHAGNVAALLARCPSAVLVTSWGAAQQLAAAGVELPVGRVRLVADGDVIDAGDRAFAVQRPPLYDTGDTLGVFDTATGVYWAVDCFACRLASPGLRFAELDPLQWRESFVALQQWGSPWLDSLELRRWELSVEQLERRDLTVIASAHGPTITLADIPRAIALLRELPELAAVPPPVG